MIFYTCFVRLFDFIFVTLSPLGVESCESDSVALNGC